MVLTKDLSRLGRDYILTGYYLEKFFPENHVRYISLLDNIDTGEDTASNDLTPFRAVFNDMYAKDISNKIKVVKHNKQYLGLFIGSKAPFGYKLNKKFPNKLFIDKEAQPIIEKIFFEAASGNTCRKISNKLNQENVPTPSQYAILHGQKVAKQSSTWSDTRIREIIQNEVYIGNMVQGRMKKINYKSKKNMRLSKENWIIVKNTHKPIIDIKTFQKANEMINLRKQTRIKNHDYLLKGLVYCHECNQKMGCTSRHLSQGTYYYFRCNTHISNKTFQKCFSHSFRMDYVENFIIQTLKDLIISNYNKNKLHDFARNYFLLKNKEYKQNLDFYIDQLNKVKSQIDKLYNDKLLDILSLEDFNRIYSSKKSEQQNLLLKINELNNYLSTKQISSNSKWQMDILEKIHTLFNSNIAITRNIVTTFIEKIELDKNKKIYVYFKFKSIQ